MTDNTTDFNPSDYTDTDEMGETFLDIDTSDAIEPTTGEDGEHLIRITGFKKDIAGKIVRTSASGHRFFIVSLDLPNDLAAKSFSQIYSVPKEGMSAKQLNNCKWDLECFKKCFGLSELNFNEMEGKEGYALLGTKTDSYGTQNFIKKLIAGA